MNTRGTTGQDYVSNFQVTVLKPEPRDEGLEEAIIAEQNAIADARVTEAKGVADANATTTAAEAETAAAASQTELARQWAPQQAAEILGLPIGRRPSQGQGHRGGTESVPVDVRGPAGRLTAPPVLLASRRPVHAFDRDR